MASKASSKTAGKSARDARAAKRAQSKEAVSVAPAEETAVTPPRKTSPFTEEELKIESVLVAEYKGGIYEGLLIPENYKDRDKIRDAIVEGKTIADIFGRLSKTSNSTKKYTYPLLEAYATGGRLIDDAVTSFRDRTKWNDLIEKSRKNGSRAERLGPILSNRNEAVPVPDKNKMLLLLGLVLMDEPVHAPPVVQPETVGTQSAVDEEAEEEKEKGKEEAKEAEEEEEEEEEEADDDIASVSSVATEPREKEPSAETNPLAQKDDSDTATVAYSDTGYENPMNPDQLSEVLSEATEILQEQQDDSEKEKLRTLRESAAKKLADEAAAEQEAQQAVRALEQAKEAQIKADEEAKTKEQQAEQQRLAQEEAEQKALAAQEAAAKALEEEKEAKRQADEKEKAKKKAEAEEAERKAEEAEKKANEERRKQEEAEEAERQAKLKEEEAARKVEEAKALAAQTAKELQEAEQAAQEANERARQAEAARQKQAEEEAKKIKEQKEEEEAEKEKEKKHRRIDRLPPIRVVDEQQPAAQGGFLSSWFGSDSANQVPPIIQFLREARQKIIEGDEQKGHGNAVDPDRAEGKMSPKDQAEVRKIIVQFASHEESKDHLWVYTIALILSRMKAAPKLISVAHTLWWDLVAFAPERARELFKTLKTVRFDNTTASTVVCWLYFRWRFYWYDFCKKAADPFIGQSFSGIPMVLPVDGWFQHVKEVVHVRLLSPTNNLDDALDRRIVLGAALLIENKFIPRWTEGMPKEALDKSKQKNKTIEEAFNYHIRRDRSVFLALVKANG